MTASGVKTILDAAAIDRAVTEVAASIAERNAGVEALALIGIRTRGVPLARRLARCLAAGGGVSCSVGALDITLYRDDFTTVGSQAILRGTEIEFPIDGVGVVLVDDVLYTGRTIRAALDGLVDLGRPRWIQLAVLVDRGHRELPIRADFVGLTLSTRPDDFVQVSLREIDDEDSVVLGELPEGRRTRRG